MGRLRRRRTRSKQVVFWQGERDGASGGEAFGGQGAAQHGEQGAVQGEALAAAFLEMRGGAKADAIVLNGEAQAVAPGKRDGEVQRAVGVAALPIAGGVAYGFAGGAKEDFGGERRQAVGGLFCGWLKLPGDALEGVAQFAFGHMTQGAD